MDKNEVKVIEEVEVLIGEKIPRLKSIKAGITGLYSFGYTEENDHIVAHGLKQWIEDLEKGGSRIRMTKQQRLLMNTDSEGR